jgi:hypothetical protein
MLPEYPISLDLITTQADWEIVDGNPHWRGLYDKMRNRRFMARELVGNHGEVDLSLSLEARKGSTDMWCRVMTTQINKSDRPPAQIWILTRERDETYITGTEKGVLFRIAYDILPTLLSNDDIPPEVDMEATIALFLKQVQKRNFNVPKIIPKRTKLASPGKSWYTKVTGALAKW